MIREDLKSDTLLRNLGSYLNYEQLRLPCQSWTPFDGSEEQIDWNEVIDAENNALVSVAQNGYPKTIHAGMVLRSNWVKNRISFFTLRSREWTVKFDADHFW